MYYNLSTLQQLYLKKIIIMTFEQVQQQHTTFKKNNTCSMLYLLKHILICNNVRK